ncbi:hypothetical protein EAO75_31875 [Streptomyces sp. uw30]|nr:hypothetical protein EAO75_31875 [Streptomyces sp. uw30]
MGTTGGIIAALIGAWAALRARRPREAELELVDVSAGQGESTLVHSWEGRYDAADTWSHVVVLDVKLRNRGGSTAVLKRLELEVEEAGSFGFSRMELMAAMPSSATYDIELSPPRWPYHPVREKALSQVIPAGDADRFEIRLHVTAPDRIRELYRLRFDLFYNGDDRRVCAGPIAVAFPRAPLATTEPECARIIDILAPARFMSPELRSTLQAARALLAERSEPSDLRE